MELSCDLVIISEPVARLPVVGNMPHPIEKLKKLVGMPEVGEQIAQRLAAIVESSDDAIASK